MWYNLEHKVRMGVMSVEDVAFSGNFAHTIDPKGRVTMPGPVDAARILVFELVDGAFEGVSGPVGPDWSKARG